MSEKHEIRYATEAYELFRLFERIGRSFYGLLLLEIGWLLWLVLAAKLTGKETGPPTLALPVLSTFTPPFFKFEEVRLTVISVVGGILIFAGWVFYSRLHHYLVAPVALVLRPILKWLLIAVFYATIIVSIPLLLITWPVERWLLRRQLRKEKRERIERFKQEHSDEDPEIAYTRWVEAFKKEHGEKMLETLAREKVPVKTDTLISVAAAVLMPVLKKLQSSGRIGLAPLASYTYAEDFQAAKVWLQIFAVAIAKLNTVLRELDVLDHVKFYILPAHFKIFNNRQASFVSHLFGLDALLWGSYVGADGETVWMNIHTAFKAKGEKKDPDRMGLEFQHSIFPYRVEVEAPLVTFSQKDHREAYIVLLTALIQTLQSRQGKRSGQSGHFRYLDQLYLGSRTAIDSILLHLVSDALQFLPNQPLSEEILPSARAQLAEIAGKWAGQQLSERYGGSDRDLWQRAGRERIAGQLYAIAEKCSRLMPDRSEHFYRLGAIACILGDKEKALRSFKQAGAVDANSTRVHSIGARVLAEMELKNSNGTERSLARFAAHAACAINTGDSYALKEIQKAMDESDWIRYLRSESVPVVVVQEMLREAMPPSPQSGERA